MSAATAATVGETFRETPRKDETEKDKLRTVAKSARFAVLRSNKLISLISELFTYQVEQCLGSFTQNTTQPLRSKRTNKKTEILERNQDIEIFPCSPEQAPQLLQLFDEVKYTIDDDRKPTLSDEKSGVIHVGKVGIVHTPKTVEEAEERIKERCIIVARDLRTQEIIGFAETRWMGNGLREEELIQMTSEITNWHTAELYDYYNDPYNFGNTAIFENIGVSPTCRLKNVATALEMQMKRIFQQNGIKAALGEVLLEPRVNHASLNFHRKMGWKNVGYRKEKSEIDGVEKDFAWLITEWLRQ
ncbi:GNAT family N-acetyltransferase [Patescibacteria group bacterium]